jgi:hypothetical protein
MSSNSLYIKNIVSNSCGGIGSWRFNALSSPAPGAQSGGFKKKKATQRKRGRGRQRKTRRKQKVY